MLLPLVKCLPVDHNNGIALYSSLLYRRNINIESSFGLRVSD